MSSTVKSLKVTCNPPNEKNTFTNGDLVTGYVTLEVEKDCQIQSLSIKFKGKSVVMWTERHGKVTVVYHSKDKYFSSKHFFIGEKDSPKDNLQASENINKTRETYSNVVAPGSHVYPFTFQIPSHIWSMASSFMASTGRIVYSLEAELSRSMRISAKDSTKINFVSNVDMVSDPRLMVPQHESKDKKLKFFNSGTVAMDVNIEKTGYFQGEGLKVLASIQNNSSRAIKPKYSVYQKQSFFANGKRRLHTRDILKEVGEPIPASASQTLTRVITIPRDCEPSILNCSNIKVEYRLRVYLDVKYASDPEIKFPITILPASQAPAEAPPPAAAAFGFGAFGYSNPPVYGAPQQPTAPQPFDPPPSYGSYAMYPPVTDYGNKYQ